MPDSPIENILSRATQDIRKQLEEAFEAGRATERDGMKREIVAFLSHKEPSPDIALAGSSAAISVGRASPGTVKPAIMALIKKAPKGIRTAEIIERTGFKENSVRGTLSTLRRKGFADQRGSLWFSVEGPPALASEPS
jgi:IclR helix-turn-helix domain